MGNGYASLWGWMMLFRQLFYAFWAALCLSSVAFAQQNLPAVPVDYSLDEMTQEDRDELAKLIDGLARAEVIMATCVARQNYDVRLREEIESCIVPESIQRVQNFFDERVEGYSQQAEKIDCQNTEFQSTLPQFQEDMDSALWRLGLMCDLCILC
ncbi:MAG: hypothetical protein AAF293_14050 [Pseudomonadota bacterium]